MTKLHRWACLTWCGVVGARLALWIMAGLCYLVGMVIRTVFSDDPGNMQAIASLALGLATLVALLGFVVAVAIGKKWLIARPGKSE